MKRVLLAALLGGLIHFVWGAFSWMVLPWHDSTLKDLPGESTILPVLRQNVGEAGIYWFPGPQDAKLSEASAAAFEKRHNEGPIGWLVYHPQGRPSMPKSTFVKGLLIDVLSALLAASLVSASAPRGYVGRVFLVIALGLFAALVSHAMQWNWMLMPAGYTAVMMADLVLGWSLAGLVIAALVRRRA